MTRSEAVPRTSEHSEPALARAGIDRAADERGIEGLLESLRADERTRVVVVHGDRGLISVSSPALRTVSPAAVGDIEAEWAFLGRDAHGLAVVLAALPERAQPPSVAADDAEWHALRAVGAGLSAIDAGILVEAVALGRWLCDAPFCPACGSHTQVRAAGWARHCPECGREHFPRTDPAVIVAVESSDGDRLLLGKNALWAARNVYSTFAGFIEAGESAEAALVREVREEAGVIISDLRYRGSQAWPYPRSLMLGFRARCAPEAVSTPDGEEIIDTRWFTRAELSALAHRNPGGVAETDAVAAGSVVLPGPTSIAYQLILDWIAQPSEAGPDHTQELV